VAQQLSTVTFTGAEDFVDLALVGMTANYGVADAVTPTDGQGDIIISYPSANRTQTNLRVQPSARFQGTVDIAVYDR
jgi:hypothetical protein